MGSVLLLRGPWALLINSISKKFYELRTVFRILSYGVRMARRQRLLEIDGCDLALALKADAIQLLDKGIVPLHHSLEDNLLQEIKTVVSEVLVEYGQSTGRLKIDEVFVEERVSRYPGGEVYDAVYHHLFGVDNAVSGVRDSACVVETKEILLRALGADLQCYGFDVYVSKNSFSPRRLHMDGVFAYQYKTFIALTDVEDTDGPCVFLEGSHKNSLTKSLYLLSNFFRGRNVREIHDREFAKKYICKKALMKSGSAILSDQHGFHGGSPQSHDGFREALVLYWTDSSRAY